MARRVSPEARERRFWRSVSKSDGCWEWTGCLSHNGYGQTSIFRRHMVAHRAAYVYAVGPIPDGLNVLHHCDNRKCCRPDHLFLGTAADNAADMIAKGRSMTGANNNAAKLDRQKVDAIREAAAEGESTRSLAARYGVTMANIWYIVKRVTWQ